MKDKKTKIAIISVVALLLVLIGVTYAYWLVTKTQTNPNIISSACLDITLDNESAAINLGSQYPMSYEEGMKLTPYTFTVTNNCNTSIDYQVALESIGDEEGAIKASALQVALDESADLLSNRAPVTTTVSGAYAAHRLGYETLTASGSEGSSITHSLRIWIDENAPISEANKTFQSKISVTIGQGVSNPIKEGTMAYDILANNNEPTTLNATWVSKEPEAETYSSVSKTANNWYGTEYTFDTETRTYQLSGDLVQATLTECRDGTKACGEYTVFSSTQDYKRTALYKITSFTSKEKADTSYYLYMTTQSIKAKNDFSTPTVDGEGGLYKVVDDLGESYYYRGDVTNNYVQFGQYAANTTIEISSSDNWSTETITFNEDSPIYWRIVRINGDGTIRLIYAGTTKSQNGTNYLANIGATDYFNSIDYSTTNIKDKIDTWYQTHLHRDYGKYIADGIFCNDKEVTASYYYDENHEPTTQENAVYTDTQFASRKRLQELKAPILTCKRKEDRYTVNQSLGNGLLIYPIGLLTADEVMFAGGSINDSNPNFYLASDDNFWLLTPDSIDQTSVGTSIIWRWDEYSDNLFADGMPATRAIRPVINLRADVEFTGDGSYETPYVIKTN